MSDYKKTLNLPETSFPMKANLTQNEPEMLKYWETIGAYDAMVAAGGEKGMYVLHDGPPYANGHLHLGHALNKVLKDIIVKSRNMQGFTAPYVPGWDCHGLPIELKVEQELSEKKKELPAPIVRRLCREYAAKWVAIQRKEFKRLGVFGTWENPYLSMDPAYESATARELGNFMSSGSVIRSKKPIHWCGSCHTALAEAEVEYHDHTSPSIFVRFPIFDKQLQQIFPSAEIGRTWAIIWTTTPWTLPDNLALSVHPDFDYALVKVENDYYILAEGLFEVCRKEFGWLNTEIVSIIKGEKLEGLQATHPFYNRPSVFVLGSHVTMDAGTGIVHTAPGHGREDYDVGIKYGLDILSPMDDNCRFYDNIPFVGGKTVFEANPIVIKKLIETDKLLAESKVSHSYPHCWRCKNPVIFRATTQWFISMEKNHLRTRALDAIRSDIRWVPSWGEERIYSMIENRPDWCISRQRIWGVPIVALLCDGCGEAWHNTAWNKDIAERFAKHPTGCDYWFEASLEEIVPSGLTCPHCNASQWKKETDILDVWFDSGTSFAAVLEQRSECRFPADLYLEGTDQHRGWFHSSLLAAMGTRGTTPYKSALTHGYVVDGSGKKMSKSLNNGIEPDEVINKHGAEILRMWVASVDYREDVRISEEILSRQVDAYRRIRNTCRYLLGNLGDFTPDDAVNEAHMDPLDLYAIDAASRVHYEVQQAYADYEFHKVFHSLHNLCVTDLSAFYLDILKDRLYSSAPKSLGRRSAQTALWRIFLILISDMAPVLSFTAEETFRHLPKALKPEATTVFCLQSSTAPTYSLHEKERNDWTTLLAVKAEVTRAIEPMRRAGDIGHVLDTSVTLFVSPELEIILQRIGSDLRSILIVSQLSVFPLAKAPADAFKGDELEGIAISVKKAEGEKCSRCWIYSTELGTDPAYPAVCPRCAAVLQEIKA